MSMSELMSSFDLASYAEIGLVLFLLAFAAVIVKIALTPRRDFDDAARLPLDDDPAVDGGAR